MFPIPRAKTFHKIQDEILTLLSHSFVLNKNNYDLLKLKTINSIKDNLKFISKDKNIRLYPYARTALFCFLKSLDLPCGSEVIISGAHIKGFLQVIKSLNLKPVIVDIEKESFSLDTYSLRKSLSNKTKVIIITYLFGYVPKIDEILNFIPKDILIIEDISQGIGGTFKNKYLGTFGEIAIMSTSLGKYIDGSGGAIMTISKKLSTTQLDIVNKELLDKPSFITNLKRQKNSIIFNILTSVIIFPFCFTLIFLIEKIYPDFFRRFGASDFSAGRKHNLEKSLSRIHFQDISPHSLIFILKEIPKLFDRIDKRRSQIKLILDNLNENSYLNKIKKDFDQNSDTRNTYWQFILNLNTRKVRKKLLNNGIESSCTNLANLSEIFNHHEYKSNEKYRGIKNLFNKTIFFPINENLSKRIIYLNTKIFNKIINQN